MPAPGTDDRRLPVFHRIATAVLCVVVAAPALLLVASDLMSGPAGREAIRPRTLPAAPQDPHDPADGRNPPEQSESSEPGEEITAYPPASVDAQQSRILPPVPVDGHGSWFFEDSGNRPEYTFSPCRRLAVVVNPSQAPAGGFAAVQAAVQQIRAATGLALYVEGTTSEWYSDDRPLYQPRRYGNRWAPILVSFLRRDQHPRFEERSSIAFAGSDAVIRGQSGAYVTGAVTLDTDYFADPNHAKPLEAVLLHEFGHVMGLDHVDDLGEVMGKGLHAPTLGPGDRTGLALAGRGPCTGHL